MARVTTDQDEEGNFVSDSDGITEGYRDAAVLVLVVEVAGGIELMLSDAFCSSDLNQSITSSPAATRRSLTDNFADAVVGVADADVDEVGWLWRSVELLLDEDAVVSPIDRLPLLLAQVLLPGTRFSLVTATEGLSTVSGPEEDFAFSVVNVFTEFESVDAVVC